MDRGVEYLPETSLAAQGVWQPGLEASKEKDAEVIESTQLQEQWVDHPYSDDPSSDAHSIPYPFSGNAQRQAREVSRTPSPPTPRALTSHRREGTSRQAPAVTLSWDHDQTSSSSMQGMMQVPGSPHHAQNHITAAVTYSPHGTDRAATQWSEAPSPVSSQQWGPGTPQNGMQAFFPAAPAQQGFMSCVPPPPNMPAPGWVNIPTEYATSPHSGQHYLVDQSSIPYVDDQHKNDRSAHSLDSMFTELQARGSAADGEVQDDQHMDLPVLLGTENGGPPSPCRPSDESPRRQGLMYHPGELLSKGALLGGATPHVNENGSEVMGFCLNSVPEHQSHSRAEVWDSSRAPVSPSAWLRQGGEDQASDTQDASASSSSAAAAPVPAEEAAVQVHNDTSSSPAESNADGPGGPGSALDPGGLQDWSDEQGAVERWADGGQAGDGSRLDASARQPGGGKEWLQAGNVVNGRAPSPALSYRDQLRAVGIQSLMGSSGQQVSQGPQIADTAVRASPAPSGPASHGVLSSWLNSGQPGGQVAYNVSTGPSGPAGTHMNHGYSMVRPPQPQWGAKGQTAPGPMAPLSTMPANPPPTLSTVPSAEVRRPPAPAQRPDATMLSAESLQRRAPQSTVNGAKLGSPELPNVGSMRHEFRQCKPCAFVNSKGCNDGVDCRFCHLCDSGEKKRRKKERAALRRANQDWGAVRSEWSAGPTGDYQDRWRSGGWS